MRKYDVVGFGGMTIDFSAIVPRLARTGEKVIVRDAKIQGGGVTGNFLTQAARLGLAVSMCGFVGDDHFGVRILLEFKEDGIDVSGIIEVPGALSSYCWTILDERREKHSYMFPNVTGSVSAEDVRQHFKSHLLEGKFLYTEVCHLPLGAVLAAVEIAKGGGVSVVLDLDTDPTHEMIGLGNRSQLESILNLCDVVCVPVEVGSIIASTSELKDLGCYFLERGAQLVAITLGPGGCCLVTKSEYVRADAFHIQVADTTGAGDAFHGGLVYGLLKGWPLDQVARFANACGAICCTEIGARSMATLETVTRFLNSRDEAPMEIGLK